MLHNLDFRNSHTYIRFLFPFVINAILQSISFCKTKSSSGAIVPFRPSGYIFGIVWFCLYFLIGLSWNIASQYEMNVILINIMFIILILSLSSWIIVYSCLNNKIGGIYVICIAILMTLIIIFSLHHNSLEQSIMIPLFVWLLFAMLLNMFEVVMIHMKFKQKLIFQKDKSFILRKKLD